MQYKQLTLDIALQEDFTFSNFFVGPNQELFEYLRGFCHGKNENYIYIWGANGSGRSHLLQACCHELRERGESAIYIPLQEALSWGLEIWQNIEELSLVCIDDLDMILGRNAWEAEVFHVFNRLRLVGGRLLIASDTPVHSASFVLKDLESRAASGVSFHLHELSDEDKIRALQLRAVGRGFNLPEEVAKYLLARCSRDMGNLMELLNQLDRASLAHKHKITVPFVRNVLNLE